MSVADVEAATGLDFFPLLPDDIEARLERSFDTSAWDFSEFRASAEERANIESAQKPKASGTIGTLHVCRGVSREDQERVIGIIEIFIPKSVTQAIGL